VILNPAAALLGAAVRASALADELPPASAV
jgi:hypothetical protein